jgi:uncharacterized protein (TIGR03492 family)
MMDGIRPQNPPPIFYEPDAELKEMQRSLIVTLLPGSRGPEAYNNWQKIVRAISSFVDTFPERSLLFLAAIFPALSLDPLRETLIDQGWVEQLTDFTVSNLTLNDPMALKFTQKNKNATLILTTDDYNTCLLKGDCCIAMAGTATEQFVGLGKPVIAIPGIGPQFTPAFAEAQARLLGPSLILVEQPDKVATVVKQLLNDPDWLHLIAENGCQRMGEPGAAGRIANCLIAEFETD